MLGFDWVRRVTGYTAKNFVPSSRINMAAGITLEDGQKVRLTNTFRDGSYVVVSPPRIPRIIANSRTQWVVQQLEAGRVLEVKDIKVENPRWNCPYTPLKAARRYLRAKGTPVKTLRVGQHGEKRYYLEK